MANDDARKNLGATEEQLRRAVDYVGLDVNDMWEHFSSAAHQLGNHVTNVQVVRTLIKRYTAGWQL